MEPLSIPMNAAAGRRDDVPRRVEDRSHTESPLQAVLGHQYGHPSRHNVDGASTSLRPGARGRWVVGTVREEGGQGGAMAVR